MNNLYVYCGTDKKKSYVIYCTVEQLPLIKNTLNIPDDWEPMVFSSTMVLTLNKFDLTVPESLIKKE